MFNRILVPLDGSALAEAALPPAFAMAHAFGSQVILLRVVVADSVPLAASIEGALSDHELRQAIQRRHRDEAEAYLAGLRAEWLGRASAVQVSVAAGAPPELIVEEQVRLKADLIVMSTHGRSGVSRLIYGSVAEAVLRGAAVPVLFVPVRK